MAQTFYAQSDWRVPTMKVADLIAKLTALPDHDLPVVFRSPLYGSFGSNTAYSIEAVTEEHLPARTEHHPPQPDIDDETGDEYMTEPYEETWQEWKGVVLG